MGNKIEAHIRYRLKDNTIVPGVTTILGVLAKPALIHWSWDLGIKGIDYRKFRDDKADIGTLAHYLIMQYLKGEKPDTSEYSPNQVDLAENCILSFFEWEKNHPLKPILIEKSFVSEQHKFGGMCDLLARINGKNCLVDFKTGKGIYPEMLYQLAAYQKLLFENDYIVNDTRILRIGRTEGFEEKVVMDSGKAWTIFQHCLEIYRLQKGVR